MRTVKPVCITQTPFLSYKAIFEVQFLIVDHLKSVMFSFCVQIFIHKTKIQCMRTNCTQFYMYVIHKTVTGKSTLTTNFITHVLVTMLPFALLSESSEWYYCSKLFLRPHKVDFLFLVLQVTQK